MAGILLRHTSLAAAAADSSSSAAADAEPATVMEHAAPLESAVRRGSRRDLIHPVVKALAASAGTPLQRSIENLDEDLPQDQDPSAEDIASECGSSRSGSPTVSDASSIRWAPQREIASAAGRRRSVDTVSSMSSA